MKLKLFATIAFIFICNSFMSAQNLSVYGKVVDNISGKPIKDVNIYIANTQIGTTSNKYGYFEIRNLPQGTFTIVLSHISYYFIKKEVKLIRKYNDIGTIWFSLKAHELETVLVTDDEDDTWNDQFDIFRDNFIGEGENSDSTIIQNPYKIDFWEEDDKLFASAIEPIEITNKSLGYKIKYFLDYFETTDSYTKYSGNAVFIPLSTNSKSDLLRWTENRKETYLGSLRHFLETLNNENNTLPNTRQASLNINRYNIDSLTSKSDSLLNSNGFFIYYVKNVPWEVARPFAEVPISTKNLISAGNIATERYLKFSDFLRIYYLKDYENNKYLINYNMKYFPDVQSSYLKLAEDSVMIDMHGRYYDKFGIHTFGYFGQERISDMLPYEYFYEEE